MPRSSQTVLRENRSSSRVWLISRCRPYPATPLQHRCRSRDMVGSSSSRMSGAGAIARPAPRGEPRRGQRAGSPAPERPIPEEIQRPVMTVRAAASNRPRHKREWCRSQSDRVSATVLDIVQAERSVLRRRLYQSGGNAQQGRLAGAVAGHEADPVAGRDGQIAPDSGVTQVRPMSCCRSNGSACRSFSLCRAPNCREPRLLSRQAARAV